MGNSSSSGFPGILHIPEAELNEHCQLLQRCLSRLPEAKYSPDGRFVKSISDTASAEIIRNKIMSVSSKSFILDLEGSQLKVLNNICDYARRSEEFFLTVDKNQLLRTAIKSDSTIVDLFSLKPIENVISNTIRHSNVLPCDPYWTDGASESVRFPYSILIEASQENKTLMKKVHEWKSRKEECDIGNHGQERPEDGKIQPHMPPTKPQKKFWEISLADVVTGRNCAEGGQGSIWVVAWKHGKFIRKDYPIPESDYMIPEGFKTELGVMERLCHPHIVYIFGISFDRMSSSLYMECMESDLLTVILDPNVRPGGDTTGPPFLHHDAVDILLQIAEAIAHTHKNNVIHGDLKSANILISKIRICENRHRYLAKVADFGSAQVKSSKTFQPAAGTTQYAAPEVLKFREDKWRGKTEVISVPENIDVYSFGLVAFEVLTGKDMIYVYKYIHKIRCRSKGMKEGVMKGILKPPLRAECQKDKFLYYESLISLIESCWVENSKRPSFLEIIKELIIVRDRLHGATSQSDNPPGQESLVDGLNALKTSSPSNDSKGQASLADDDNSGAPEELALPSNDPPGQASLLVDNNSGVQEMVLQEAASRINGHHPLSSDQAKNTSVAPYGKEAASESNGHHPPTFIEARTSDAPDSPIIRISEIKDLNISHSH